MASSNACCQGNHLSAKEYSFVSRQVSIFMLILQVDELDFGGDKLGGFILKTSLNVTVMVVVVS
jgi:hypothetical protein